MRVPQPEGNKGSLKWIQKLVNEHPQVLDREIKSACNIPDAESITWVSPLREDEYAEYRDDSFLAQLDVKLGYHPLNKFWPDRGPQWDALGKTHGGAQILVEAKAHVDELESDGTQASGPSRDTIQESLWKVQEFLGVDRSIPWTGKFYQYANRLAHLYLLRELNEVNANLVFVYFIGDKDVKGPNSEAEWKAALTIAKGVLGLGERHQLSKYIGEVFIDVRNLKDGS